MRDEKDLYLEEIHHKLMSDPEELRKLRIQIDELKYEYYLKNKQDEIKYRKT